MEIIRNNYIDDPSKEKEEELKFSRANMIRAIGDRWKTTIEDFTHTTNQSGIFCHQHFVSFEVENDKEGMVAKRRQVTYLYATKPGQDYPRKPRVVEVFKGEGEMDYCIRGLKKRKRAEDEVDETISATTNHQASIDYYDTSYWNSGEAKHLFVPPVGESVSDCLEKRIYSLRQSNYLKASWADVVDTYDKDGLCKPAAAFKIRQQCQLLCQAYIFALDWMNQQNDYDVPNKTWKECCEGASKHLNPCGNLVATTGETIVR
jgi:hypothetical protein